MLTKQQEIDTYRGFVQALPRSSYLADIFRGTEDYVADLIYQDLCFPAIHILMAERTEENAQLAEIRKQIDTARRNLADIQRQHQRTADALAYLKNQARRLADLK